MPISPRETLLCRYRYDPLDRSIDWAPDRQASIQRFYCKSRLATEIQGAAKYSFLQHDEQVLAQQRQVGDKVDTTLLATDQQRSVLNALDTTQPHPRAYSPYGHRPLGNGLLSLLGFNGERPDPVTGHYHLGNGYRQFNPTLMRFNSPDSWSPFGKGGLNAYMYCGADPINRIDPTGHVFASRALITNIVMTVSGITVISGLAVAIAGFVNGDEGMEKVGAIVAMAGTAIFALGGISKITDSTVSALSSNSSSTPRRNLSTSSRQTNNLTDNRPSPPAAPPSHRTAAALNHSVSRSSDSPPSYQLALSSSSPPPAYNSIELTPSPIEPPTAYYPSSHIAIGKRAKEFLSDTSKSVR